MSILGLGLVVAGAVMTVATAICIAAYIVLTAMDLIEKFMKKYFPQKYYYDWDEEEV